MTPRPRTDGSLAAILRNFRRGERGLSLIEFALIFPLMVMMFLGAVEFGEAFTLDRKLSNAASTTSDLVAQLDSLTTADLNDIALVADEILRPYSSEPFGLVLTSVVADQNNNTTVDWSYARGPGATARATGTAVTLPAGLTEPNSSIIMAEASYGFSPSVGLFLTGVITLNGTAYFRPRLAQRVIKTD